MRLWIDDVRPAPEGWIWVKTSKEAINFIQHNPVTEISFDHDLGEEDTAYDVALYLEEGAILNFTKKVIWHIHSANPIGRKRIEAAMKSAERFWAANA